MFYETNYWKDLDHILFRLHPSRLERSYNPISFGWYCSGSSGALTFPKETWGNSEILNKRNSNGKKASISCYRDEEIQGPLQWKVKEQLKQFKSRVWCLEDTETSSCHYSFNNNNNNNTQTHAYTYIPFNEYLLCSKDCAQHFPNVTHLSKPIRRSYYYYPHLQIKELKLGKVQQVAEGY